MAPSAVLIVVAGPSGTGKGTVVRRLLEHDPTLQVSVSATTRPPRPDEVEGREYFFIDEAEFRRRITDDGFVEWFEVFGDLKGTPRPWVERQLAGGADVVLEVDVKGAQAIRLRYPEALLVFLRPPSREVQHDRLRLRGDDPADIERRLARAADEERIAEREFDAIVVNDDLDRAVDEVASIVERYRRART